MNDLSFKISVIIPCYNCERTIVETIESLLSQTTLPDEIICVDDGSTDKTKELLQNYSRKCLLLKVISVSNGGVSVARNIGMNSSTGDILLFLDSDDCYCNDFLENVRRLFKCGYDCVAGKFTHSKNKLEYCKKSQQLTKYKAHSMFMCKKNIFHTSAFAYKRDVIFSNHLSFTPNAMYGEDWEFTTKYIECCSKFVFLKSNVLYYRISETSMIRKISFRQTDAIYAAERTENFLIERKSDFYSDFKRYMKSKVIFSVLHTFARAQNKAFFMKVGADFDAKNEIKKLLFCRFSNFKTRASSIAYLMCPNLFYSVFGRN